MNVLTIKTVGESAEVTLLTGELVRASGSVLADRTLSENLLPLIDSVVSKAEIDKGEIDGVVVFNGPGSFTGLRIGVTVANTIASALNVAVVGSGGGGWVESGLAQVAESSEFTVPATCNYGAGANITKPKR